MTAEIRVEGGVTPPSPPTGKLSLYADPATRQFMQIDEFGVVSPLAANTTLPLNEKTVNSPNDLPPAILGQRFLEEGVTYTQGVDLTIDEELVCANTGVYRGSHASGATLTTTASRLFVGSNSTYFIRDIRLACPNGTVFDFEDTAPVNSSILNLRDIVVTSALKLGTFTGMLAVVINSVNATGADGFTFVGSGWFVQDATNVAINLTGAGIGIDFGTSVTSVINLEGPVISGPAGSTALSGAANSTNIISGSVATVANSTLNLGGLITPLAGISPEDIRWQFTNNGGVADSSIAVDTYLAASRTVPITTAGVYVPVNGADWASDVSERFSTTDAGLVTYINERSSKVLVQGKATVEKVGGGSDEIALQIAINGVPQVKTLGSTQNTSPTAVSVFGLFTLNENDTVQLFTANLGGTSDIVCSSAALAAINGF